MKLHTFNINNILGHVWDPPHIHLLPTRKFGLQNLCHYIEVVILLSVILKEVEIWGDLERFN